MSRPRPSTSSGGRKSSRWPGDETDQQLAVCMAMADRTIVNDGTIEELRRKVEELL